MTDLRVRRGERTTLDEDAAAQIVTAIQEHLQDHPHVVLGVVGGRSVGGIYGHLQASALPWEKIHVFLADERLVPVTSEESNWRLVEADLLARPIADGRLPRANLHPFPFEPGRAEEARDAYDQALGRLGGRFDVVVLSAGEDGHTASLFPDHPSVRDRGAGFVLVDDSPKPPPRRVSASRSLLARAGLGVLVFYGEAKRAALEKFEDGQVSIDQCPSKVVTEMPTGLVLTDLQA